MADLPLPSLQGTATPRRRWPCWCRWGSLPSLSWPRSWALPSSCGRCPPLPRHRTPALCSLWPPQGAAGNAGLAETSVAPRPLSPLGPTLPGAQPCWFCAAGRDPSTPGHPRVRSALPCPGTSPWKPSAAEDRLPLLARSLWGGRARALPSQPAWSRGQDPHPRQSPWPLYACLPDPASAPPRARVKKHGKEATKPHDLLAAAIHMKALPSEYGPGTPWRGGGKAVAGAAPSLGRGRSIFRSIRPVAGCAGNACARGQGRSLKGSLSLSLCRSPDLVGRVRTSLAGQPPPTGGISPRTAACGLPERCAGAPTLTTAKGLLRAQSLQGWGGTVDSLLALLLPWHSPPGAGSAPPGRLRPVALALPTEPDQGQRCQEPPLPTQAACCAPSPTWSWSAALEAVEHVTCTIPTAVNRGRGTPWCVSAGPPASLEACRTQRSGASQQPVLGGWAQVMAKTFPKAVGGEQVWQPTRPGCECVCE